jgi:hypothetical protein
MDEVGATAATEEATEDEAAAPQESPVSWIFTHSVTEVLLVV